MLSFSKKHKTPIWLQATLTIVVIASSTSLIFTAISAEENLRTLKQLIYSSGPEIWAGPPTPTEDEKLSEVLGEFRKIAVTYSQMNTEEKLVADIELSSLLEKLKSVDASLLSRRTTEMDLRSQERIESILELQNRVFLKSVKTSPSFLSKPIVGALGLILAFLVWIGNTYFAWRKDIRETEKHSREMARSLDDDVQ